MSARRPEETLEQYHERLGQENKALKAKLKGKLVWNSAEQGTYKRPDDVTEPENE